MKTKALYTGSFDPLTNGHLNIIERSAKLYDELTIGIIVNPSKKCVFSLEERKFMIEDALKHLRNVKVDCFSGLLANYVNDNSFNVVVRGLRATMDFEYEIQMAQMNARLFHETVETVFLMTDPQYSFISSSMIKEVYSLGAVSYTHLFIGLAECLKALLGVHHGESQEAQSLGLEIIGFMRKKMDEESQKTGFNYTLIATPAEGLSGRFVRIDRAKYGVIEGVTDRDYYTNSFHIPVYYHINAFDKIKLEAPYHALTNAGHITYVELDGDPCKNLDAFEQVVRCMKESGVGYGSINHPVDRDPVCGYTGIIDNECPCCHRTEDDGDQGFERIRRITGYLVGTMDNWNDAKTSEEKDRVKHSLDSEMETL